jgi:hypothetical protein
MALIEKILFASSQDGGPPWYDVIVSCKSFGRAGQFP